MLCYVIISYLNIVCYLILVQEVYIPPASLNTMDAAAKAAAISTARSEPGLLLLRKKDGHSFGESGICSGRPQ